MADEPTQVQQNTEPVTPPATPKAEDIAESLINALENRAKRAETSVIRSFSEQYGLSEDEIKTVLSNAKAERDKKIPAAAQAEIDKQQQRVNNLLITAELKAKGAEMGLVDTDTAMLLLDKEKVKVEDNGTVTGVEDALKALKEAKPYLFGAQPTGKKTGVGGRIDNTQGAADGVEEAFLRKNPGLKI